MTASHYCLNERYNRPGHRLDDRGLYLHFHHNHRHHHHHQQQQQAAKPTKPPDASGDSAAAGRNPDVARAVQVAGFLGLRPVGWVVARPGGVLPSGGKWGGVVNQPYRVAVPLTSSFAFLLSSTAEEASAAAAPGGDGGGFLNAQEVVVAARLQVQSIPAHT